MNTQSIGFSRDVVYGTADLYLSIVCVVRSKFIRPQKEPSTTRTKPIHFTSTSEIAIGSLRKANSFELRTAGLNCILVKPISKAYSIIVFQEIRDIRMNNCYGYCYNIIYTDRSTCQIQLNKNSIWWCSNRTKIVEVDCLFGICSNLWNGRKKKQSTNIKNQSDYYENYGNISLSPRFSFFDLRFGMTAQDFCSFALKYSPRTDLIVSGILSSLRAFRSWSKAFTISSLMLTMIFCITMLRTLPLDTIRNLIIGIGIYHMVGNGIRRA